MKGTYFNTPIKAQPEPTPTKDVEVRLECLKLAVIGKGNVLTDMVIADAQHFYDWITKTPNQ
jgi:hypothetical protein